MRYHPVTGELKRIKEYSGLSFKEINELEIDEYLLLLRDAFIYDMNKSEKGKKYLNECYMLENKEAQRAELRSIFGKS